MEKNKILIKPPLGLMPKKLFLEQRFENIKEAIERYVKADKEIPNDWLDEYEEILNYLKKNENK